MHPFIASIVDHCSKDPTPKYNHYFQQTSEYILLSDKIVFLKECLYLVHLSRQQLNMAFHLHHRSLWAFQAKTMPNLGPLINVPVTQDDSCAGHRLSLIWASCQGADCQRAGKLGQLEDDWFTARDKIAASEFGGWCMYEEGHLEWLGLPCQFQLRILSLP